MQDSLLGIKEEVSSVSMVVKEGGATLQVPEKKSSTKSAPQPSKSVERNSRAPKTKEESSEGAATGDQADVPTPFEEELPEEGDAPQKKGGAPKSAYSIEKKRKAGRTSEAGGEHREDPPGAPGGAELVEEPKEGVGETGGSASSQAVEQKEQAFQTTDSSEHGGCQRPGQDVLKKRESESVDEKNTERRKVASEVPQSVEKKQRADKRKGGVEVAGGDQAQTTKVKIDPSSSALLNKAVLKRHLKTEFPGVRFSADFFPALGNFVKDSIIRKMQEVSEVEKKTVTDRDILE